MLCFVLQIGIVLYIAVLQLNVKNSVGYSWVLPANDAASITLICDYF